MTVRRIRDALLRCGVDALTITADDEGNATVYLLFGAGWRDALRCLRSHPWVESAEMASNVRDGSILRVKLAADGQDGDPAPGATGRATHPGSGG